MLFLLILYPSICEDNFLLSRYKAIFLAEERSSSRSLPPACPARYEAMLLRPSVIWVSRSEKKKGVKSRVRSGTPVLSACKGVVANKPGQNPYDSALLVLLIW